MFIVLVSFRGKKEKKKPRQSFFSNYLLYIGHPHAAHIVQKDVVTPWMSCFPSLDLSLTIYKWEAQIVSQVSFHILHCGSQWDDISYFYLWQMVDVSKLAQNFLLSRHFITHEKQEVGKVRDSI